jgi:hypothetical protein
MTEMHFCLYTRVSRGPFLIRPTGSRYKSRLILSEDKSQLAIQGSRGVTTNEIVPRVKKSGYQSAIHKHYEGISHMISPFGRGESQLPESANVGLKVKDADTVLKYTMHDASASLRTSRSIRNPNDAQLPRITTCRLLHWVRLTQRREDTVIVRTAR